MIWGCLASDPTPRRAIRPKTKDANLPLSSKSRLGVIPNSRQMSPACGRIGCTQTKTNKTGRINRGRTTRKRICGHYSANTPKHLRKTLGIRFGSNRKRQSNRLPFPSVLSRSIGDLDFNRPCDHESHTRLVRAAAAFGGWIFFRGRFYFGWLPFRWFPSALLGRYAQRKARDGHQNEQKLLESPHRSYFLSLDLTQSGKKESASPINNASTMPNRV